MRIIVVSICVFAHLALKLIQLLKEVFDVKVAEYVTLMVVGHGKEGAHSPVAPEADIEGFPPDVFRSTMPTRCSIALPIEIKCSIVISFLFKSRHPRPPAPLSYV